MTDKELDAEARKALGDFFSATPVFFAEAVALRPEPHRWRAQIASISFDLRYTETGWYCHDAQELFATAAEALEDAKPDIIGVLGDSYRHRQRELAALRSALEHLEGRLPAFVPGRPLADVPLRGLQAELCAELQAAIDGGDLALAEEKALHVRDQLAGYQYVQSSYKMDAEQARRQLSVKAGQVGRVLVQVRRLLEGTGAPQPREWTDIPKALKWLIDWQAKQRYLRLR